MVVVETPGTAPGSAVPIARRNLSPYPGEPGTPHIRHPRPNEKGAYEKGGPCPRTARPTDAERPRIQRLTRECAYFFSASRISVSRSTSLGPAAASGALGIILLACLTIRKITKAKITKLMIAVMNDP